MTALWASLDALPPTARDWLPLMLLADWYMERGDTVMESGLRWACEAKRWPWDASGFAHRLKWWWFPEDKAEPDDPQYARLPARLYGRMCKYQGMYPTRSAAFRSLAAAWGQTNGQRNTEPAAG